MILQFAGCSEKMNERIGLAGLNGSLYFHSCTLCGKKRGREGNTAHSTERWGNWGPAGVGWGEGLYIL